MEVEINTVCVKVDSLRKKYGKDMTLAIWMKDENNLYVGRHGRIFINGEIYPYQASKWANPFKLTNYSLEESLKLYREHVIKSDLANQLDELRGKTLGCWCDQSGGCHAKVLKELFEKRDFTIVPAEVVKAEEKKEVSVVKKAGICKGKLKNGKDCSYKASVGDYCKIHHSKK